MTDIQAPRMSVQQYELEKLRIEFEIEKLRIENSSVPIGRMIRIMTFIAGAIALLIILCVVAISVTQIVIMGKVPENFTMPDVLVNWGGIILGFYFGQYISLVKDYMGARPTGAGTPLPPPPSVQTSDSGMRTPRT